MENNVMENENTKDIEIDLEQTGDKVVGGMRLSDLDAATGETTTGRRGRGHGSNNGKTAGRGQKGQEARSGGQSRVLNRGSRVKDLTGARYHIIRGPIDT